MISEIKYGLFKYDIKDYYAILGLPIDANAKEVRARYIKIAYQLHPDTCASVEPKDKKKASTILSKLVNPAYENLYKDKARRECELILAETARKLASEPERITLSTDLAQKLYQEPQNRRKIYRELINKIVTNQYEDFNKVLTKIALLSELNMVYAICEQESQGIATKRSKFTSPAMVSSPVVSSKGNESLSKKSPNIQPNISLETQSESLTSPISRLTKLIESAKQHQEKENIQAGILDLREALKIDPNNSTCHALIGSFYLRQNNMVYAKVHIKKAIELDSNNPLVKKSKHQLQEQESNQKPSSKSSSKSGSKTKKSSTKSKDKKEKKEAPKIFGIPLW